MLVWESEAKVTVTLSVPFAAQLISQASEWCWASGDIMAPGQTIPLTSHPCVLKSSFTVAHLLTVPLSRKCHFNPFTEILETLSLLWVFCFLSPLSQPAHYLPFEGQLQNALKYSHVTRECWSSSALSCFCDRPGASGSLVCAKGRLKTMGASW